MTETKVSLARRSLKSPRSAAIAGIIFAVLYGASLVLIRLSIPADVAAADPVWLKNNAGTISLALFLVPYAGIAFLWFIGVIRDLFGELEDRLFATVFLGSGLLFLAMTFIGAALAGALVSSYANAPGGVMESGIFTYNREVMYRIINVYSFRMAGVFMISLGTIWYRTGLMHRGWAFLTYALALVLLLSIGFSLWVTLIFPGWVFMVSVYILVRNLRHQPGEAVSERVG
jgi:hypothetical protein